MTLFINMRRLTVGGGLTKEAYVLEGAALGDLRTLTWAEARARMGAKKLLIFCHGFNVGMQGGVDCAVKMEAFLKPQADECYLAVLWPGDFVVPVVNYSFEYKDAVDGGKLLAAFIATRCAAAPAISLGSHSLGGRLVLEAIAGAGRSIANMCLAAPAVDASCLTKRFAPQLSKVGSLSVLASKEDQVLRWAYPLGDFFSDVFGDDDSAFGGALGRAGPRPAAPDPPVTSWTIPSKEKYGHGSYVPGAAYTPGQAKPPQWVKATRYWGAAMRGQPVPW